MSVSENLDLVKKEIPSHVKLVAVSKTMPVETILLAYDAGQRLFGENKSQELQSKQPMLPDDIKWHFIGHLQTNKVKYLAPYVSMIESVDSMKLLQEINKQAEKQGRVINCLFQFHIATEETKFGLDISEAEGILEHPEFNLLKNIRFCGVMGMASFVDEEDMIRKEFRHLKSIFHHIKTKYFDSDPGFCEVSMGMTGDYKIAIEEGSTIVRIGTGIFGKR